jgi:hypothetical protein
MLMSDSASPIEGSGPPLDIRAMQEQIADSLWRSYADRLGPQTDEAREAFLAVVTGLVCWQGAFVTSNEIRDDLRVIRELLEECRP